MIFGALSLLCCLAPTLAECDLNNANVMILLDNSWSIRGRDWIGQRNFIADLVMKYPEDTQVGVVLFGVGIDPVRTLSAFTTEMDRDAVSTEIREMHSHGRVRPCTCSYQEPDPRCDLTTGPILCGEPVNCDLVFERLGRSRPYPWRANVHTVTRDCNVVHGTSILEAIVYTLDRFRERNLLGTAAANQIVLIGDGAPYPNETELEAFCNNQQLKADLDETQVFILGIGTSFPKVRFSCFGACDLDLNDMCPVGQHKMITVSNYRDLSTLHREDFCPEIPPPCGITTTSGLNVIFLIDGSHSISLEHWTDQVEFAAQLALDLPENSHVGVIKFGTGVETVKQFDKTEEFDKSTVMDFIRSLVLGGYVRPCECVRIPFPFGRGVCDYRQDAQFPCRGLGRSSCELLFATLVSDDIYEYGMDDIGVRPVPQDMNRYIGPGSEFETNINCVQWGETHIKDAIETALGHFSEADVLQSHNTGDSWNLIYLLTDGEPHPHTEELNTLADSGDDSLDKAQIVAFIVGEELTNDEVLTKFNRLIPETCIVNVSESQEQNADCLTEDKIFFATSFQHFDRYPLEKYCGESILGQVEANMQDLEHEIFVNDLNVGLIIGTIVMATCLTGIVCWMYRRKQWLRHAPDEYREYVDEDDQTDVDSSSQDNTD